MIKPDPKIEPLREDLNELIPNQFYTTTTYKRWLVANKLHDLWGKCLEYAKRQNSFILMGDTDSIEAGDAMTCLLNTCFEKDLNFIINFITQLLKLYAKETDEVLDITNLRQDLIIIGVDEEELTELDELGKKDVEVPLTDETLTDEDRIRNLEKVYIETLQTGPNYRNSIEAYHEWYTETLMYLSEYYTINNPDFAKFKNVDNSKNGFGLKDNYYSLKAIYNLLMKNVSKQINFNLPQKEKTPMVFISHSSEDKLFVEALVDLLEGIGFTEKNLFCSSVDGYGIPLNGDIFETLRGLFTEHNLFVIFVHSEHYYKSPVSLNEMGAAWVLRTDTCSILTKDMNFQCMKGVVNSNTIAIKVNAKDATSRLNELKDRLIETFNLVPISETKWERKRNMFLSHVNGVM